MTNFKPNDSIPEFFNYWGKAIKSNHWRDIFPISRIGIPVLKN